MVVGRLGLRDSGRRVGDLKQLEGGGRRYRLVVDDEGYEGSVAARPPRHDGDASKSSRRINSC